MECGCGAIISRRMKGICMKCRYEEAKKKTGTCVICGKIFIYSKYHRKTCSKECSIENNIRVSAFSKMKSRGPKQSETIKCARCGIEVKRTGTTQKYCSECAVLMKHAQCVAWQYGNRRKKRKTITVPPLEEGADPQDAWMPEKEKPAAPKKLPRIKCNPRNLPVPRLAPTRSVRIGEVVKDSEIESMIEPPYTDEKSALGRENNERCRQYTPEEDRIMMQMHEAGETNRAIAKRLDRAPYGIEQRIKKLQKKEEEDGSNNSLLCHV